METAVVGLLAGVLGAAISFLAQWWQAHWQHDRAAEDRSEARRIAEADRVRASQKDAIAKVQEAIFEVSDAASLVAADRLYERSLEDFRQHVAQMREASFRLVRYASLLQDENGASAIEAWSGWMLTQYSGHGARTEARQQAMFGEMQAVRDGLIEYLGGQWRALDRDDPQLPQLPPDLQAESMEGRMRDLVPDAHTSEVILSDP